MRAGSGRSKVLIRCTGEWSNGKTSAFGAENSGSNPGSPAKSSVRLVHEHLFVPRKLPFSEIEAREAIAHARCWSEAARFLGYRVAGGNVQTVMKHAARWEIPTDHFDPREVILEGLARGRHRSGRRIPIDEILVPNSTYCRSNLKNRLYKEGLKERACELCGQGEDWCGRKMSLILDHINGVGNDNRIENLRIVCPNCAATLDTHCGRNLPRERPCPGCGTKFAPRNLRHRYCTRACFNATRSHGSNRFAVTTRGLPRVSARRVERPPYDQLLAEIKQTNYSAVGRKYGVSDNAIRKWVRSYENEIERQSRDGLGDEEEEK